MKKVTYQWICSGRKTLAIQVKSDGKVIVRTPYGVSQKEVEAFVLEKQAWILKNLEKVSREESHVITEGERRKGIELARVLIPERTAYYAEKMQVTYGKLTIREQKTRWGSCSSKGNLNFNWKLVLMPEEILDYVVVHELAHRREMNHSPEFWKVVEHVLPDYRERRKWLREHGKQYT